MGPATARGVGEVIDSSSASICNFCLEIHLLSGRLCSYSKKGIFIIYGMWPKCLKNKKRKGRVIVVVASTFLFLHADDVCTLSSFLTLIYSITGKGDSKEFLLDQ